MVVIVFGLPGSGKTYLAKRLAAKLGVPSVSTDKTRNENLSFKTYSQVERDSVYELVLASTIKFIRTWDVVVVDGTFHREKMRRHFEKKLEGISPVRFIEVKASESVIKSRMSRTREDSDADWKVYVKIKSEWEPMKTFHLELDSTDTNLAVLLEACVKYLHDRDDQRTNK